MVPGEGAVSYERGNLIKGFIPLVVATDEAYPVPTEVFEPLERFVRKLP